MFSQPKATLVKAEYIFAVPPTPACHASTIVELSKNTFMASWFGGKYESSPDVGIWIATNEKGKWSEAKQIANGIINDTLRYPCKNPREWWGMKMTSEDNGKHWTKAEKLPEGILGPIKNKPFLLASGEILYPSSTESLDEKVWNIHLEKSDKNAQTFKKINIACDTFGVIQPSILQYSGNKLQLLCRSRQNAVVQTWSNDNGNTWSPLTLTNLPNPNSGTD
eukprot:gene46959-57500_t